jgi:hypothetical protein
MKRANIAKFTDSQASASSSSSGSEEASPKNNNYEKDSFLTSSSEEESESASQTNNEQSKKRMRGTTEIPPRLPSEDAKDDKELAAALSSVAAIKQRANVPNVPVPNVPRKVQKVQTVRSAEIVGATASKGFARPKPSGSANLVIRTPPNVVDVAAGAQAPLARSQKTLDPSQIPPRPATFLSTASTAMASAEVLAATGTATSQKSKSAHNQVRSKPFLFRIEFTDGVSTRKFLDVVASAVTEMRFHVCATDTFVGLRLEAHDEYWQTAIKSQLECSVVAGTSAKGDVLEDKDLHGTSFCVPADSFMKSLDCALLKDTPLSLTQYHGGVNQQVTFEAITNEDDVHTAYTAPLIDEADAKLGKLDNLTVELGFHVNVTIEVLQKLTGIAKKCAAPFITFDVFQAADPVDSNVLHSRMRVGFDGVGGHDFFVTARKNGNQWEPKSGPSESERQALPYVQKSSNKFDAAKLRTFVSKLSTDFVLVHLSNTNDRKPIVLECTMGGEKTRHTIMLCQREVPDDTC